MNCLPGLELDYKSGCDCEVCKTNKTTYQRIHRFVYGRDEAIPYHKRELFIGSITHSNGVD